MKRQKGFTLVEIAIVLVIIGLILGGVLKGQELIDSARVKSLSNDLNGSVSAWFSFIDRYRALPGDYKKAKTHISATAQNGDGNAQVNSKKEAAGVWQHLSIAGFISGQFDGAVEGMKGVTDTSCRVETCPENPYNGFYKVAWGNQAKGIDSKTNEIYTGAQIPAKILYQLDTKIDDGTAGGGDLRYFNGFQDSCITGDEWNSLGNAGSCAGVLRTP